MLVKKRLAHRIVSLYHDGLAADRAQRDFEAQFSRREVPENVSVVTVSRGAIGIKDLLVKAGLAPTGSAAWRAVDQGAVSIEGQRIRDRGHVVQLDGPIVLRLGRRIVRVDPGPDPAT
jgi:tyrosyl-tRNA synthetase